MLSERVYFEKQGLETNLTRRFTRKPCRIFALQAFGDVVSALSINTIGPKKITSPLVAKIISQGLPNLPLRQGR